MPFCTHCGKPIKETQKFCGACGMQIESEASTENRTAMPPPSEDQKTSLKGETLKIIIPNLMLQKSWGRSETFNLIVTDQRSIFARLTSQIMNETVKMRREKAAAEGKGFFGKWAAQMKGFNTYTDRYQTMNPDEVLSEDKENFQIQNSLIKKVKSSSDTLDERGMYTIEFTTTTQKLRFKTQYNPDQALKAAYNQS
ncbi:MAG TPA: zinc ribbon domain-containing protein [Dehalococcoidales bacterium]|nr:zinc ribbon domain-containing protein [Dehalococcoidales bacterium]